MGQWNGIMRANESVKGWIYTEGNLTIKCSPIPEWRLVPNQIVDLSFFVTTREGGHDDHIFTREREGNDGNNSEGSRVQLVGEMC